MTARKITQLALMTALSLALAYVERLFPLPVPVPGVKVGLSNLVTVFLLYRFGARDALVVNGLRVVLAGFLFGSLSSMLYALSGALAALIVMAGLKRVGWFSAMGVSVAGSVAHVGAQLLTAALITHTPGLTAYLPVLMVSGIITGAAIGFVAGALIRRVPEV